METRKESAAESLLRLKDLTRRLGVVHEAQTLQLQLWPRLLFSCGSSQAKVDVDNRSVAVELSGGRQQKGWRSACQQLAKNVRWLLGDEWKVTIAQGKRRYQSGRKAAWAPDQARPMVVEKSYQRRLDEAARG